MNQFKVMVVKAIPWVGGVIAIGFIFLIYYGHKTACPGAEVYVKCKSFF